MALQLSASLTTQWSKYLAWLAATLQTSNGQTRTLQSLAIRIYHRNEIPTLHIALVG